MSKEQRGNRESKKPKHVKPKTIAAAPSSLAGIVAKTVTPTKKK